MGDSCYYWYFGVADGLKFYQCFQLFWYGSIFFPKKKMRKTARENFCKIPPVKTKSMPVKNSIKINGVPTKVFFMKFLLKLATLLWYFAIGRDEGGF